GLFCGYLLRTKLQADIQLGNVQLQALDLLDHLHASEDLYPDAEFRARVAQLMQRLDSSLQSAKVTPDVLTAEIKPVDDLPRAASADLEARRATVRVEVNAVREVVVRHWAPPPSMTPLLQRTNEILDEADRKLEAYDATVVVQIKRNVIHSLVSELNQPAGAW